MQYSDSAADRKLIAERLHAEQWTVERIAAALNVSRRAVTRDLEVPKPVERRRCKTCHSMFTPKRSDARHCSTACKQKAYRQSLKRSDMPDEALVLVGEARREAIKTIKRRHYTQSVPSGKSHYCGSATPWSSGRSRPTIISLGSSLAGTAALFGSCRAFGRRTGMKRTF